MQSLAREMGFSETTFVLKPEQGGDFRMRIFTPARELPFAGHPTLGTAFALAGPLQSIVVRIETAAGIIPVALEREGAKLVFGRMQQPVPTVSPFPAAEELLDALGVADSKLPVEVYDNGVQHAFVMLDSFAQVAALKPDLARLEAVLGEVGANVFAVEGATAKTRVWFPEIVMVEDPATGSAAGPLAVHLARHGVLPWGEALTISQGVEIQRPSTLYAWPLGDDGEVTGVDVGGSALVVGRGEFLV
jgi:trans-2,3-dihydro-3-hydroxyanthranilate isomerase